MYKTAQREGAKFRERISVMDKYRTEIYNENTNLYTKLAEKDKDLLRA
jgi:hypothetical protein